MNIEAGCINVSGVHKRRGQMEILTDVSFSAKAGRITAFLGRNGAGKSSTLRILLGLDWPTAGTATFEGKKYQQMASPLLSVGAVFDGIGGVPARKVYTHLLLIAQSNGIPKTRVDEVLDLVDLSMKSKARLGTLSLGEGQRLGLASALLGQPQYLVLDEPMNGLDPVGRRWLRDFLCNLRKEGKTILLSSHLLTEVEAIADDVIIIDHGKIKVAGELHTVMQSLESLEDVFFALTEGGQLCE